MPAAMKHGQKASEGVWNSTSANQDSAMIKLNHETSSKFLIMILQIVTMYVLDGGIL